MYALTQICPQATISLPTLADVLVFLNNHPQSVVGSVLYRNDMQLKITHDSNGNIGIFQSGNIEMLCLSMINEIESLYIKPNGHVLQPYEMLPEQWEAFLAIGSACNNVYPCFTEEQRRQQCKYVNDQGEHQYGTIANFMSHQMMKRFGYSHNGPDHQSNGHHAHYVAYALAAGKTVPLPVMQWYQQHPTEVQSVGEWFALLLNHPAYRGTSVEKLSHLVNLRKWEQIELTHANASHIWLSNQGNTRFSQKNGTLNYAKLVHGLTDFRQSTVH
jgi:hypothetical protein